MEGYAITTTPPVKYEREDVPELILPWVKAPLWAIAVCANLSWRWGRDRRRLNKHPWPGVQPALINEMDRELEPLN